MYYHNQLLKSIIFSCNSNEDLEDQGEKSQVYEPATEQAVVHGENCQDIIDCKVCTCKAEIKRVEEERKLWWKRRRRRKAQAREERDFFDPTTEYWNREGID